MNSNYSLILATDLDGTFLGGSEQQRADFYQYLQKNRDRLLLIFVTGRDLDLVRELYDYPNFPQPDYIIGGVGTTVVAANLESVTAVQNWIEGIWQNSNDRVKELLANEPGIKLQPISPERRVSYFYNAEELQESTLQKIVDAGFDYIQSADVNLDVMPKGVSKGPTLLKLIELLELDSENVVLAGDTLNDLTLFETGLKSVAVGNSEPKLVEKIKIMDNVYHSPYPGSAGIWDALKYYQKEF